MDTLAIKQISRRENNTKNNISKTNRMYYDFIISGQSLGQLLEINIKDLIGTFGWSENIDYEIDQINEFLGIVNTDLNNGRIGLYVCPECGEVGCGGITAKMIWDDFAYEYIDLEPKVKRFTNIGPFKFNKNEYFELFEKLKIQLTQ